MAKIYHLYMMETFLLKGDIIPSKICEYLLYIGFYITHNYKPLYRLALTFIYIFRFIDLAITIIYISLSRFSDNYHIYLDL